jgi:hypothetical protein
MEVAQKAMETRDELEKQYEHWALWIVPNGNFEVVGADKVDENYQRQVVLLQQAQQSVGGRLLTSESE